MTDKKETFAEFDATITDLTEAMREGIKAKYPDKIDVHHFIGACMILLGVGLRQIEPEARRRDLILTLIPKLLELVGAEAMMVQVSEKEFKAAKDGLLPDQPHPGWFGGPVGQA